MDRTKAVEISNLIYNLENVEFFEDEFNSWLDTMNCKYENNISDKLVNEILVVIKKHKEELESKLEEF